MLVVSPICGAPRGISAERRYIQMYAGFVRAEFRDANIYTRVNLQSDGVNYAFSQSPLELNTGSEMAAGTGSYTSSRPEQLFEIAF